MRTKLGFAALFVIGGIGAAAQGQIVPIGEFVGDYQEDMESQIGGQFDECLPNRVFDATADLCTPGSEHANITSGWSFQCTIYPHGGSKFFGSAGQYAEYTFDEPVGKFGGWFGSHSGYPDATVEFYDVNDNLLGSVDADIPADCEWYWHGWETQGEAIARISVIGDNPYGGGFILMDDMEYSLYQGGGFVLALDGDCPGLMTASVTGATPYGMVAFAYGFAAGSTEALPVCPGVFLDIAYAQLGGLTTADANGDASVQGNVPAQGCGNVIVQALDVESCTTSNVVGI